MIQPLKNAALPLFLIFSMPLAACGGGEKAEAAKEAPEEEHAGAETVKITAEAAKVSDIGIEPAAPGAIRETIELTGRIALQPSARAEIHAPYPGPVRAVLRNIGDRVGKGQMLARVESSESLQTYGINSPIAGLVLERRTNVGDVTGEEPLFVVGDLSKLQAELNVAPRDIGRVASGQTVLISGLDDGAAIEAQINAVLPTADARSQTLVARAPFASDANSPFRPGMAVRAAVIISQTDVSVAVNAEAVQTFEGKSVIFVKVSPDTYEARPVTIGRTGKDDVEVTSGLKAGEQFVSKNAFLVKAEIGKGAAGHD